MPHLKAKVNSLDDRTQREIVKTLAYPELQNVRFGTLCNRNPVIFGESGSALRRAVQNRHNKIKKIQSKDKSRFREICLELGVVKFGFDTANRDCSYDDEYSSGIEISDDDDKHPIETPKSYTPKTMSKPPRNSLTSNCEYTSSVQGGVGAVLISHQLFHLFPFLFYS